MFKRFRVNNSVKLKFASILGKKEMGVNADNYIKPVYEEQSHKKETIKKALWKAQGKLNLVLKNSLDYKLRIKNMNLNSRLDENVFTENIKKAESIVNELNKEEKSAMERYATITATENNIRSSLEDISTRIEFMESRPDSNIDLKYQEIRDEMVVSLGLKRDDCLFAGELMEIKNDSFKWQGAIEKALGDFVFHLIVPEDYYSMVKRWFSIRDENFDLKVISFDSKEYTKLISDFRENSFVNKVIFRDHEYSRYLMDELCKYDFSCVENKIDMKKTPFSITKNGEIHFKKGKYSEDKIKIIENERFFNLGFSNEKSLSLYRQDKEELNKRLSQNFDLAKRAKADLHEIFLEKNKWQKLLLFKWKDINAEYYIQELKALKLELQSIEKNDVEMAQPANRMVLA